MKVLSASGSPRRERSARTNRVVAAFGLALAVASSACETNVAPEELCEGFVQTLQEQQGKNMLPHVRDAELSLCIKENVRWRDQNPKSFNTMAKCALAADSSAGWVMCGFGHPERYQ